MRIGFHSPLPPARTGVADYSAALLGALRNFGDVALAPEQADIHLYHLGNNQLHRGIYQRALDRPGIVVLHDAVLQHFFLGNLDEQGYVDEFVHNYGEWNRDLAGALWRGRASSGTDSRYFQYPMLKRIAERSLAVVVHNPSAAQMVRRHAPSTPVVEIPLLFQPPALPASSEASRFRQSLGIHPGAFVFGIFGYMRESKRILPVLRAFEKVKGRAALLFAGEWISSDLARAAAPFLKRPGVFRIHHTPEPEFWRAALCVDACINLRYPTAGETSQISIQMMGIGKAVMVTAGPETSRMPETACLRIETGIAEESAISDHMVLLCGFPSIAREIGRQAAEFVASNHSADRAAGLYWKTLCDYRS